MASLILSAMMVLTFLVMTAFGMAEASGMNPQDFDRLEAKVKIMLHNKCKQDVQLKVGGRGKGLDCKKGKHEVLGPLKCKLLERNLLKLELFVFDKHGKLLKDTACVKLNLALWGVLHKGVTELVFDVVEEVLEDCKVIKLLCDAKVLAKVVIKLI